MHLLDIFRSTELQKESCDNAWEGKQQKLQNTGRRLYVSPKIEHGTQP